MRDCLLNDFVGHIEDEYGIALCESARAISRQVNSECAGQRLCKLTKMAASQLDLTSASILEKFGRTIAKAQSKNLARSNQAFVLFVGEISALVGEIEAIDCSAPDAEAFNLVVHYHDGSGCGYLIAGVIAQWAQDNISCAILQQDELSAVAGSHMRFRLTGEIPVLAL